MPIRDTQALGLPAFDHRGPAEHEWTVLCPGPSLEKAEPEGDPRNTIAVNNAIEHPAAGAYWMTLDQPSSMSEETMEAAHEKRPVFVTSSFQAPQWRKESFYDTLYATSWLANGEQYPIRFSSIAALFFAFWRGATHIDLFGCDLRGIHYYGSRADVDAWKDCKRWNIEQDQLTIATRALLCNGCTIDRHPLL